MKHEHNYQLVKDGRDVKYVYRDDNPFGKQEGYDYAILFCTKCGDMVKKTFPVTELADDYNEVVG